MTASIFDEILFDEAVFDGTSLAVLHWFGTVTGGANAWEFASLIGMDARTLEVTADNAVILEVGA